MTPILSLLARSRLSGLIAGAVCASALALVWVGYRAVREWERSAAEIAARRADSAADLLSAALSRDMQGAQQLLTGGEQDRLASGPAVDLLHPIASAFALYPYIDTFFSWRPSTSPPSVTFYSRIERRPQWFKSDSAPRAFPVVVGSSAGVRPQLVDRVMRDAYEGRRLSVFDVTLHGASYQAVAIITYRDPVRNQPDGVLGYLVDLQWTRRHYFSELAAQVARIEGSDGGIEFAMVDDQGRHVVGTPPAVASGPVGRRPFPMAFFDPQVIAVDPPPDFSLSSWTAIATAQHDPALATAERGARRAIAIAVAMAIVLSVGLILSLQASRASAQLVEMRSDFVSAVTHELKTPIANLRAIHETLASGRGAVSVLREYSQMGVREAARLARLVDNLLAYARITDVADAYAFESVDLHAIVERTIREFAANLEHGKFDVHTELPEHLPMVRADATALNLMLNNLVDNAIRYSPTVRHLHVGAVAGAHTVTLTVSDKGIGIPADELPKVTRKFTRGRGTEAGGSGLGLAIVDRIVHDHGGSMRISSEVGAGTSVAISLPIAA